MIAICGMMLFLRLNVFNSFLAACADRPGLRSQGFSMLKGDGFREAEDKSDR
jgi:hypothetical protein